MAPKIFVTGATGYVAGDALYELYQKHPEYEYTALVKSEEKGKPVKDAFPKVRLVIGDCSSVDLIAEEAAKADVVIHTADASDNVQAAKAIAKGLASGHSKENPGFWLHTSGTGVLAWESMSDDKRLGEHSDREYNDWTGLEDIINIPADAFHKNVDDIVLNAGSDAVKTAIVCPPTIFGRGRGPARVRSRQLYEMATLILKDGYIPVVGQGKARMNCVHVADLTQVFVLLTEAALSRNPSPELWNERGYFFTSTAEYVWSDVARKMGKKAVELGLVQGELEEKALSKEKAIERAGFEAASWGFNSRGKSERAKKVLGWKPSAPSLDDTFEEILKGEKSRIDNE